MNDDLAPLREIEAGEAAMPLAPGVALPAPADVTRMTMLQKSLLHVLNAHGVGAADPT